MCFWLVRSLESTTTPFLLNSTPAFSRRSLPILGRLPIATSRSWASMVSWPLSFLVTTTCFWPEGPFATDSTWQFSRTLTPSSTSLSMTMSARSLSSLLSIWPLLWIMVTFVPSLLNACAISTAMGPAPRMIMDEGRSSR